MNAQRRAKFPSFQTNFLKLHTTFSQCEIKPRNFFPKGYSEKTKQTNIQNTNQGHSHMTPGHISET